MIINMNNNNNNIQWLFCDLSRSENCWDTNWGKKIL